MSIIDEENEFDGDARCDEVGSNYKVLRLTFDHYPDK